MRAAVLAAIAVAAVLVGAGAIWNRHQASESTSATPKQPATRPDRRPPAPTPTRSSASPRATGASAPGAPLRPPGRPPAFHAPGAPKEPLDEIRLPARARRLAAWLAASRRPSGANVHHWLYQHGWIVAGARFGWWHGAEALRVLIRVDRRVESRWRFGYRSEAVARRALAEVEAKAR